MKTSDILNLLRSKGLVKYSNLFSDRQIAGISDDSRYIQKNFVFIAIRGLRVDGNNYITDAVLKGAAVIISEVDPPKNVKSQINFIKVENARKALSLVSSYWYDFPSKKIKMIGVTGTKGKTTVVHLVYHIMKDLGLKVGMISTVKAEINNKVYDTGLHVTNPEPLILHKLLKDMIDNGLEYAVVEVTSHGLDQERVYGINFDIGILSNIVGEHLDYHKTFSNYRNTKLRLFENSNKLVINKDDASCGYILKKSGNNKKKIKTYSQINNSDLLGRVLSIKNDIMKYSITFNKRHYYGKTRLLGGYNLYNILAAISVLDLLGMDIPTSLRSLESFNAPQGRLEKIENKKELSIYIDFAHTPDSLENLLNLLSETKKNRLICIFGCAGERDKKKRFKMGKVSGKLSDVTIITAEDPRSEDILDICRQIKRGVIQSGARDYFDKKILRYRSGEIEKHSYLVIPDRAEAIYYSINNLVRKGDTLVVCGKGHEKSMCYGNIEHPWSDREEIEEALSEDKDKTAVVLGAGKGKRLNSELPKVIHKLAGKPMLSYTINNLRNAGFSEILVIVGYEAQQVMKEIGPTVTYAYQKIPLGTGHAALQGINKISGSGNPILVVNGDDSAFYKPQTFKDIYNSHIKSKCEVTFTSTNLTDPTGIGRLVRDINGKLIKIVEEKVATEEEKKIMETNIGMYVFDADWFLKNIKKVKKGIVGEYYITDLIGISISQKEKVNVFQLRDANEWCGVNTREQLEYANKKMMGLVTNTRNEM